MSRGNAGVAHRAERPSEATSIDFVAVFEQVGPPCLLLRPDLPRFSAVAANSAFTQLCRTAPALAGSPCADVLAASGLCLHPGAGALEAALERATAGAVERLLLAAPEPSSGRAPGPGSFGELVLTPVLHEGTVSLIALRLERVPAPGTSTQLPVGEGTRQLAAARQELSNTRAELEAFGYSVSHDLRSPLRAIDGFAQALAQDCGHLLDERAHHYLERVQAGAQRMSSLLDDLLELSRIQLAPLERGRVNVSDVARRVAAELGKRHPERSLALCVEDDLEVHADPRLVALLLTQLLDNAWKFTSKKPHASVRVGRDASFAAPTLFVADDGAGFDMAYAKRLFSPFQRLHRASDYDGNGIGLAIAQRIIRRHGGRLWAEAEPERGACFRFCLEETAADG